MQVRLSPSPRTVSRHPTHSAARGNSYAELISGGVAAFAINSSTGALTNVPGSPFPTGSNDPAFIAGEPSGKFIYVADIDAIDGYVIDANSGALSPIAGSPFLTASSPQSIAVDPSGTFLYASGYQDSVIFGFSVDSGTGSLTALVGSPFPSVPQPTSISTLRIP